MDAGTQLLRCELGAAPISEAVTRRGKTLRASDTVADARRRFDNASVQVLPVLEGDRYLGAVDRATIAGRPAAGSVGALASPLLPTVAAGTPADDALTVLDERGGTRLVVLSGGAYLGLVCLRGDRERLCVDAECHASPAHPTSGKDAS